MTSEHPLFPYRHRLLLCWLAAFMAYHMAWTAHFTAAFTLNGFDLAEQVGYHPGIRAESPPLRTAGLLRLPIPLIATGIAMTGLLYIDRRLSWGWRALAMLVALRSVPPQGALRHIATLPKDDYAFQLAIITGFGLLGVLLTIPTLLQRWFYSRLIIFQSGLMLAALLLPLPGLTRSIKLLHQLGIGASIGGGVIVYAVILCGGTGMALSRAKK